MSRDTDTPVRYIPVLDKIFMQVRVDRVLCLIFVLVQLHPTAKHSSTLAIKKLMITTLIFRHSGHSKACTGPINPHYSSACLSQINFSSTKQHQRKYILFICPDGAPQVWNIFLVLREVRLSTDFVWT